MRLPLRAGLSFILLSASACAPTRGAGLDDPPAPRRFATRDDAARYLAALLQPTSEQIGALMMPPIKDNPAANEMQIVLAAWTDRWAPPDTMLAVSTRIVAKHLSADDMAAWIQFLESPAGRRINAAQVAISREGMDSVQARLAPHQPELQRTLVRMMSP